MKRGLGGQGSRVIPAHQRHKLSLAKTSQTRSSKGQPEDETAEGSQSTSENTAAFQGK